MRTLGTREGPYPRVLRSQVGVSRRTEVGFRELRQQGGVCKDLKQQEGGSAKALAVGGGSAPEQTRTPYLYPAILPRSQEKQIGDLMRVEEGNQHP